MLFPAARAELMCDLKESHRFFVILTDTPRLPHAKP